jgi:FtsP/CotA-like multicopper oxidase with cupredoxin domain
MRASVLLLSILCLSCTQTKVKPPAKEPAKADHSMHAAESPVPAVREMPVYEGEFGLTQFQDIDPSPAKIEVNLEAKPTEVEYLPGTKAQVWAYNGTIPGPLLEGNVGDEVTVHFKNSLPESTTIHWHGLRLPAEMDGTPAVQNPVKPGESFDYKFVLRDAGLYWFHPHIRSDKQVEKGLYGVIIVRDKSEPDFGVSAEKIMVLDDVLLNEEGDLARFLPETEMSMGDHSHPNAESQPMNHADSQPDSAPMEHKAGYVCPMHPQITSDEPGTCSICKMALVPAGGDHQMSPDDMEAMIGRHGNVLLVNGKPHPKITIRAGERQRWRLVNSSNSRYFRLSLPGHQFTLIGVDGGLLEAPRELDELMLTPGERADVLVEATGQPGDALGLMTLAYARGHGLGQEAPAKVLQLSYSKEGKVETKPIPTTLRAIEAWKTEGAKTKTLRLSESMDERGVRFYINSEAYPKVTQLRSKLGETEVWEIINDSEMDHPFHLHGFFFQVLDRDGVAAPYRAIKDTVNIPGKHKIRIAVKFDGFAGSWMYHCHILEHGERGMMGELLVDP